METTVTNLENPVKIHCLDNAEKFKDRVFYHSHHHNNPKLISVSHETFGPSNQTRILLNGKLMNSRYIRLVDVTGLGPIQAKKKILSAFPDHQHQDILSWNIKRLLDGKKVFTQSNPNP